MELGNLTLMCVNLVCVSSAGVLVIWAIMHIQSREKRQLRIYDEPHFPDGAAPKLGKQSQEEPAETSHG